MLEELKQLVWAESRITADILEKLQRVYDRRDFSGYRNLFEYMVKGLGYSEATACLRQNCLKLIAQMPELKEKIQEGSLNYTTLGRSYKFIKAMPLEEKKSTLISLENKPCRKAIEILEAKSPAPVIKVEKLHFKDKVRLTIDLSHDEYEKLEQIKALRSHKCRNMNELILTLISEESGRFQKTDFKASKSKNPRAITQKLRNHLFKQAAYRCQQAGCTQNYYLQIDHIKPVRKGGTNRPENLQVLCAYHNRVKG